MTYRVMFGGYGPYCGRVLFGGDRRDRLSFKALRPWPHDFGSTCEVPVDFLEDAAQRTIRAQLAGNL